MQSKSKSQQAFLVETDKLIWTFFMKMQRLRIAKMVLKKNKVKELKPLNIKAYFKAKVIKVAWH